MRLLKNPWIIIPCLSTVIGSILGLTSHHLTPWEYAVRGTVIQIGNTYSQEDMSTQTGCIIDFEDGTTQSMSVYGNIMVGQQVWKHCWVEDDGEFFYGVADTRKRHHAKYKVGYKYYKYKQSDHKESN